MSETFLARVRRLVTTSYSDSDSPIAINPRGDSLVAQSLPRKTELARLGNSWSITTPLANAFQPVAALPTTRAEMVLYNGDALKSYVIDSVFVIGATSIGVAGVITLLGQLVPSGTAPTDNAAVLVNSRSCRSNYGGKARKAIANTAFGIADKWEVLGNSALSSATTAIGLAAYADVEGGFIVPPGGLFLANAIAGTAGGTCVIGIVWHEVELSLGG